MPIKLNFNRRQWAVVILLIAVLLNANFANLVFPFWEQDQNNPLAPVIACAEQFSPYLQDTTRAGYFYDYPQNATFFADNRSAYQLQLQYALVPILLDSRPEIIQRSDWVIGYFANANLAESEAAALAPSLGLKIESLCGNYVLFRRNE